ncbi:MAG TPA: hypothetical protein VK456_02380 [Xanthobacteraceae bacterium]|nr:hypothetical protein [Xanthobacteraceae bacterium]
MSKFRSLLENAIARLPENSAPARQSVYTRARNALEASLSEQAPQRAASLREDLEAAIRALEQRHRGDEQALHAGYPSAAAARGETDTEVLLDKQWLCQRADGSSHGPLSTLAILQQFSRGEISRHALLQEWSPGADASAGPKLNEHPWRRMFDTEIWLNLDDLLEAAVDRVAEAGKGAVAPVTTADKPAADQPGADEPGADKPAAEQAPPPRWEVQLPDGTLRRAATPEELFPAILSGEIAGGLVCRAIPPPAKHGKKKVAKWRRVADSIGASSFAARLLFRPVWAHSLRGLEIGFVLGFVTWIVMNIFTGISTALQLAGPQYDKQGHYFAAKFAAYALVCIYWLLQSLPLAAQAMPLPWLKSLSQQVAPRAFPIAAAGLLLLGIVSGNVSAVLTGILPGLASAFGSLVAGALAGGPPGMIVGTVVGLLRRGSQRTAPGWPPEELVPVLLKGVLLPMIVSAAAITLYLRYGEELTNSIVQGFLR